MNKLNLISREVITNNCKDIYYIDNKKNTIKDLEKKLDIEDLKEVDNIFYKVVHEISNIHPKSYFNSEITKKTYNYLKQLDKEISIQIDEDILEYYIFAKDNYNSITEIINNLSYLNDQDMKTKMYRIPSYVNIIEGCISNMYKIMMIILDQKTGKQYSIQSTLNPMIEALNKNNLEFLTSDIDVDVRNAISHGSMTIQRSGIQYTNKSAGDYLRFAYKNKGKIDTKIYQANEFDKLIDTNYDNAGGILLGLTLFLNDKLSLFENLLSNYPEELSNEFLKMSVGTAEIDCTGLFETNVLKDRNQLNIELSISDKAYDNLYETIIRLAFIIHNSYRFNDIDIYFFSLSNPRMLSSWIRFKVEDIEDVFLGKQEVLEVAQKVKEKGDYIVFNIFDKDIDLNQVIFFRFPTFIFEDFKILYIKDSSNEDRKRLRASLFIGENKDRNQIIKIIEEAIKIVKDLSNPASPKVDIIYGDMEADSVYLKVYKKDGRKIDKSLFSNNDNYICSVDYNKNGKTTLKNGGLPMKIWEAHSHENLHFQSLDNKSSCNISWKNSKYRIIKKSENKKIGRNDPCPCGSGKKYKKCCLD